MENNGHKGNFKRNIWKKDTSCGWYKIPPLFLGCSPFSKTHWQQTAANKLQHTRWKGTHISALGSSILWFFVICILYVTFYNQLHSFQVSLDPLQRAFELDSSNLTMKAMPRLTRTHLDPNNYENMRVAYAFQFSSESLRGLQLFKA